MQQGALPDCAVESTPVSKAGKVFAVALLAALAWAVAPVTEAEPPIRIGATLLMCLDRSGFGR